MTATATFDILNPTPARRVIYDGIRNSRAIQIDPGETKRAQLASHVFEPLIARSNVMNVESRTHELILTKVSEDAPQPVETDVPVASSEPNPQQYMKTERKK